MARDVPVHHLTHKSRLIPRVPAPGLRLRSDGPLVSDDCATAAVAAVEPGDSRDGTILELANSLA